MITREKVKSIKRLTELFQGPKAIVHSSDIKTIAIVMPITHKNSNIATFLLCFSNVPIYKVFAVLIVYATVRF
jgi:hypothetical protein